MVLICSPLNPQNLGRLLTRLLAVRASFREKRLLDSFAPCEAGSGAHLRAARVPPVFRPPPRVRPRALLRGCPPPGRCPSVLLHMVTSGLPVAHVLLLCLVSCLRSCCLTQGPEIPSCERHSFSSDIQIFGCYVNAYAWLFWVPGNSKPLLGPACSFLQKGRKGF